MTDQSAAKSIPSTQTKISFFTKEIKVSWRNGWTPDVGQETYRVSSEHRPQGRVDAVGGDRLRISRSKAAASEEGTAMLSQTRLNVFKSMHPKYY